MNYKIVNIVFLKISLIFLFFGFSEKNLTFLISLQLNNNIFWKQQQAISTVCR
jgi:hypothetical protein